MNEPFCAIVGTTLIHVLACVSDLIANPANGAAGVSMPCPERTKPAYVAVCAPSELNRAFNTLGKILWVMLAPPYAGSSLVGKSVS